MAQTIVPITIWGTTNRNLLWMEEIWHRFVDVLSQQDAIIVPVPVFHIYLTATYNHHYRYYPIELILIPKSYPIHSMGDLQDPKMEVRKRTILLAIFQGDIPWKIARIMAIDSFIKPIL